ncbi:group 2 glycosyl transferase [Thioploca ingrica]|uniref:Group 2 glycosyl transferase n=1 Tax=Thioploca ingrica TaxID=40754 RepID=A0A090AJF2_9GAMM|nr:group 2 glycosyl transferase [Thioploca ingrica]
MNISVIFPAYNEEQNIEETISLSLEALRPLFEEFEIIIIDDASTDKTGKIADLLATKHQEIKVIHNSKNRGQGQNILLGFQQARYDLVIHNGMDYPFDFKDLSKMLPLLEEADIVVASRSTRAGYTLYRKFLSLTNTMLLHLISDLRLPDYNFVQLYKKFVLNSIQIEGRSTGFVIPEILIRSYKKGYRIKDVEIEYHFREKGVSTAGHPRVVVSSFFDLVRFWLGTLIKK